MLKYGRADLQNTTKTLTEIQKSQKYKNQATDLQTT